MQQSITENIDLEINSSNRKYKMFSSMSRVPSFDLNGGTEELDKVSLKLISS